MISLKITMVTLAALLLFSVVTAQTFDSKNAVYREPQGWENQRCKEMQTKMLYAATDLSLTLEEMQKRMVAAQAFEKLQDLDQEC